MADFYPADDDQARIRWIIIDALRRYGTDSGRIGHAFAELHRLQAADLRALVAIMSAEGNGTPLTAGQLREQLGLSSGGASLVIDRLEQAGHIRRARDHPTDNRVVHLRYTDQGKATGLAFFGSLGDRTHAILDGFTEEELQVITRFITAMADSARQHVQDLEGRLPGIRAAVPEEAFARPVVGQGGGPDDAGHASGDRAGAHLLRAEEAPACGWVDSQPRTVDDQRSARLLIPRKPGSNWSRLNKQRVERLTAAGLMQPAGLAAVAAARANGRWTAPEAAENLAEPADLARRPAKTGEPARLPAFLLAGTGGVAG